SLKSTGGSPMNKTLKIPNEPRFVRAFALAVDPGDTLSLLLEIGALGNGSLALVRRTREALDGAYDRVCAEREREKWEQTHTISVLREALAQPDAAAFLAYQAQGNPTAYAATAFAEALATVGAAADTLSVRRRPWEILADDLYLTDWRKKVWALLFTLPRNTLPTPPNPPDPGCTCSKPGSPLALADEHADWRQAR
ncbi:MAG: hypothetical protein JXA93_13935, partial [Anaerolineae bacterium]|nr:hypothetical protein [Anaerolineae bacterium]